MFILPLSILKREFKDVYFVKILEERTHKQAQHNGIIGENAVLITILVGSL